MKEKYYLAEIQNPYNPLTESKSYKTESEVIKLFPFVEHIITSLGFMQVQWVIYTNSVSIKSTVYTKED